MKCVVLLAKISRDIENDVNGKVKNVKSSFDLILSNLNLDNFMDGDDQQPDDSPSSVLDKDICDKDNEGIEPIEDLLRREEPLKAMENVLSTKDLILMFQNWFKLIIKGLRSAQNDLDGFDQFKEKLDDQKGGIASNFEKLTKYCGNFCEKIIGELLMTKYESLSVRRLSEKRLNRLMEMYKENIFSALSHELNQMKASIADFHWQDQIITENLTPERFVGNFTELLSSARRQRANEEDELVDKSIQMSCCDELLPLGSNQNNNEDKDEYGDNFEEEHLIDIEFSKKKSGSDNKQLEFSLSGVNTIKVIDQEDKDHDLELREISCSNIHKSSYMDAQSFSVNNVIIGGNNNLNVNAKLLEKENQALKNQVDCLRKETDSQQFELKECEGAILLRDKARKNEGDAKAELTQAYEKILSLNTELELKEDEIEKILQKLRESNSTLTKYEEHLNEMKNYKSSAKKKSDTNDEGTQVDTENCQGSEDNNVQEELAMLREELERKDEEIQMEANRNNELRKYIESISQESNTVKRENDSLKLMNSKCKNELENFESIQKELISENDTQKQEFSVRLESYECIKKEMEKLKNNEEIIEKVKILEDKNNELVKINQEWSENNKSQQGEIKKLLTNEVSYKDNLSTALKSNEELLNDLDTKEESIKQLENENLELIKQFDISMGENNEMKKNLIENNEILACYQTTLREKQELEFEIQEKEKRIEELVNTSQCLKNANEEVAKELEVQKELVAKMENESSLLLQQIEQLNQEKDKLDYEVLEGKRKIVELDSELKKLVLEEELNDGELIEKPIIVEIIELEKTVDKPRENSVIMRSESWGRLAEGGCGGGESVRGQTTTHLKTKSVNVNEVLENTEKSMVYIEPEFERNTQFVKNPITDDKQYQECFQQVNLSEHYMNSLTSEKKQELTTEQKQEFLEEKPAVSVEEKITTEGNEWEDQEVQETLPLPTNPEEVYQQEQELAHKEQLDFFSEKDELEIKNLDIEQDQDQNQSQNLADYDETHNNLMETTMNDRTFRDSYKLEFDNNNSQEIIEKQNSVERQLFVHEPFENKAILNTSCDNSKLSSYSNINNQQSIQSLPVQAQSNQTQKIAKTYQYQQPLVLSEFNPNILQNSTKVQNMPASTINPPVMTTISYPVYSQQTHGPLQTISNPNNVEIRRYIGNQGGVCPTGNVLANSSINNNNSGKKVSDYKSKSPMILRTQNTNTQASNQQQYQLHQQYQKDKHHKQMQQSQQNQQQHYQSQHQNKSPLIIRNQSPMQPTSNSNRKFSGHQQMLPMQQQTKSPLVMHNLKNSRESSISKIPNSMPPQHHAYYRKIQVDDYINEMNEERKRLTSGGSSQNIHSGMNHLRNSSLGSTGLHQLDERGSVGLDRSSVGLGGNNSMGQNMEINDILSRYSYLGSTSTNPNTHTTVTNNIGNTVVNKEESGKKFINSLR